MFALPRQVRYSMHVRLETQDILSIFGYHGQWKVCTDSAQDLQGANKFLNFCVSRVENHCFPFEFYFLPQGLSLVCTLPGGDALFDFLQ